MKYFNTSKNRKRNGLSPAQVREFRKTIYNRYSRFGRDLPWRNIDNPYLILVSEIMLQQTQVSRVIVKYPEFIRMFPDWKTLARAPLTRVLSAWEGLGYPRRGLALKRIAETVIDDLQGELPADYETLVSLPSVGPATAGSILAFAFGKPTVFIETNIRAVYIHFFFGRSKSVSDSELFPYIEKTLDTRHPRKWYYALMDYGVYLKKLDRSILAKSAHYRKQSPFKGSQRELRSRILKLISGMPGITKSKIARSLERTSDDVSPCLANLEREGFIAKKRNSYSVEDTQGTDPDR
jgi:A/G-specific adenine glycosylase